MAALRESLLEGLDDIGELLKAVRVRVTLTEVRCDGGDGKESGALEQNDLLGVGHMGEFTEISLDGLQVWNERVDDPPPSLVESLIPDARGVRMNVKGAGLLANAVNTLVVDALSKIVLDEVHFVDEAENDGGWTILLEGFDDLAICDEIALEVTRFNVEHVDQDGSFGEDVLALGGKVALVEGILSVNRNPF